MTRTQLLSSCVLLLAIGCSQKGDVSNERETGTNLPKPGANGGSGGSAADEKDEIVNPMGPMMMAQRPDGGADLEQGTCAEAEVYIDRIRPRIVFLVDASSSMIEDFGGPSRWDALRDALLGDGGLVPELQEIVKFGLVTYAGPRFTTCPAFRYAAPAPSNLDLVEAAFPDGPPEESSTPTGPSMEWAIDNAFIEQVRGPDVKFEPQYMIFATDGEPNGCAQGSADEPERDFDSVLAAAHKAAAREIGIFVISLAEASGEFADHLDEVADIGGSGTAYSPVSKEELVSELETIIGSAISCEVEINAGRVIPGKECNGEVLMNNEPLECNGKDGWELVDPTHLLIKGKTCDEFKLSPNSVLTATFPCEALQ